MDANQLRFWMMADPWQHWEPLVEDGLARVHRDAGCRAVRLASAAGDALWSELPSPAVAQERVSRTPGVRDAFGTWATLDVEQGAVLASGAGAEPTPLLRFDAEQPSSLPSDLMLGEDDVLYVAAGGGKVLLKDPRDRWDPTTTSLAGFESWRLAPAPQGGVFALARPSSLAAPGGVDRVRLARVSGLPLPRAVLAERAPTVFRPQGENTNPPRMSLVLDAPPLPGEVVVGLSMSPQGRLALLSWWVGAGDGFARIRFFTGTGLTAPILLRDAHRPFSLAWVADDRIVVLLCTSAPAVTAVAYVLEEDGGSASPLADYYPLTGHDGGPFMHGPALPPHYPVAEGPPEPLHPLSQPTFVPEGSVLNAVGAGVPLLDSGNTRTRWHRLYLEACLPPRCGLRVFLAATNMPVRPEVAAPGVWHEHVFGDVDAVSGARHVPHGVWVPLPSELPFHEGLMPGTPERGRRGLFTALIQRAGPRVRALQGRYLWVRVQLVGDGRSTPELFALRVYGPRFSYAENYLPEFYREQLFGPDADGADPSGASTPADFLERFLGLAEGILTPLEDRIASAALLTDPRTVPEESLEWLAGWIGASFDPALPQELRRRMLEAAPAIRPWRGTLRGLTLTLDALLDGAVSRGGLVLVEEFRLRRTFSTILGVDLADEEDPLLPGLRRSGNSYVGDTLFLGEERRAEFLALFGEGLPTSADEEAAVERFFDTRAHRLTILVHQDTDASTLGLIQRVAERETPAHVALSVKRASSSLLVGVASLVGIDTYLDPFPVPQPLRVGEGTLGSEHLLQRPPSLDPRLLAGG